MLLAENTSCRRSDYLEEHFSRQFLLSEDSIPKTVFGKVIEESRNANKVDLWLPVRKQHNFQDLPMIFDNTIVTAIGDHSSQTNSSCNYSGRLNSSAQKIFSANIFLLSLAAIN